MMTLPANNFKKNQKESLTVKKVADILVADIMKAKKTFSKEEDICYPKVCVGKVFGDKKLTLSYENNARFYYVPNFLMSGTHIVGKKYISGLVSKKPKKGCVITTKDHVGFGEDSNITVQISNPK